MFGESLARKFTVAGDRTFRGSLATKIQVGGNGRKAFPIYHAGLMPRALGERISGLEVRQTISQITFFM